LKEATRCLTFTSSTLSAQPHGRAWKIHDKDLLISEVVPNFFSQSKYESFTRQINGWGFKKLHQSGNDFNAYYHEQFLLGLPHLTRLMRRVPQNQGKLLPFVDAEPNFYEIDNHYPLVRQPTMMIPSIQGQQSHNMVGGGSYGVPLQVHGTNMMYPMDGNFTSLQIGGGVYPPSYPNQQYPVQYSLQPMQYSQQQYGQNSQFYTMPSSAPYPTTQSHHAEQVLQMVSDLNQSNHAQSDSALPLLETCEQAGAFLDKAQEDEFMKFLTSIISLF
jgi:hypothetical protein